MNHFIFFHRKKAAADLSRRPSSVSHRTFLRTTFFGPLDSFLTVGSTTGAWRVGFRAQLRSTWLGWVKIPKNVFRVPSLLWLLSSVKEKRENSKSVCVCVAVDILHRGSNSHAAGFAVSTHGWSSSNGKLKSLQKWWGSWVRMGNDSATTIHRIVNFAIILANTIEIMSVNLGGRLRGSYRPC